MSNLNTFIIVSFLSASACIFPLAIVIFKVETSVRRKELYKGIHPDIVKKFKDTPKHLRPSLLEAFSRQAMIENREQIKAYSRVGDFSKKIKLAVELLQQHGAVPSRYLNDHLRNAFNHLKDENYSIFRRNVYLVTDGQRQYYVPGGIARLLPKNP